MRSGNALLITVGLVAALFAGAPAAARQEPVVAVETPEARGVGRLVMAAELAAWGRERGSPEALRLAATLLDEVPLRLAPLASEEEEPVLSSAVLRRLAAKLEAEREETALGGSPVRPRERQAPAAPPPSAAPPPPPPPPPPPAYGVRVSPFGEGPVSTVKRLASSESWSFDVDARGAEILRVAVIGDGDAPVDLIVRDATGKTLCAGGAGGRYPVCTLAPAAPARLRIAVVNRGGLWTRVQVITN